MFQIVNFSHLLIKLHLQQLKNHKRHPYHFIDATCGLGNDTIYMAQLLGSDGIVHSYDIQKKALDLTKQKCENLKIENVCFYHCSHDNIIVEQIDFAIFNLGYLPNSDKTITTRADTTIKAITNLLKHFENNKYLNIIVVVYPKHLEGSKEAGAIDNLIKDLSSKYLVTKYQNYNRKNAPYLLTITLTSNIY